MRFLLIESVPTVTNEMKQLWDEYTPESRKQVIDLLIRGFNNDTVENISKSIERSCDLWGIDPKQNKFLQYVDNRSSSTRWKDTDNEYLYFLQDTVDKTGIDILEDRLTDIDLYDRPIPEYKYTLNLLATVLNPQEAKKFFIDTSVVNIDELYNEAGHLKPVGSQATADDTETLFGVVEMWSDGGQNDAPDDPKLDGRSKMKDPEKLDLETIKSETGYFSVDAIPQTEAKEGNVVYVNAMQLDASSGYKPVGPAGYMVYKGDSWFPLKV